jgi:hypothetical protein
MTRGRVLARAKGVMFILSVGNELYKYARSDS